VHFREDVRRGRNGQVSEGAKGFDSYCQIIGVWCGGRRGVGRERESESFNEESNQVAREE